MQKPIPLKIMLSLLILATGPTGALAFDSTRLGQWGSLPLTDIALIEKTPKLKAEVDMALAKAGKTADEITCTGARFPGSWTELGGTRVAPYTCEIGEQTLEIKARVRVTDRKGRAIEKISPAAMKIAEDAVEDRPTWNWTASARAKN
jgi:hypothetical protein